MKLKFIDYTLIASFDALAHKKTLRYAAKNLLHNLKVASVKREGEFPLTGPLLIVSNHPGELDMLTLLSVMPRSDFFFVAQSTYYVYGPTLESKLLPVRRKVPLYNRIFEYPLHLSDHVRREDLSLHQARQKNRLSIQKAADLISKNKAVSIFPMGYVGKPQPGVTWKLGVGYIAKQITHQKTKLVYIHISGDQLGDFLRFVHPKLRKFFPVQKRVVKVSTPLHLKSLLGKEDNPKEIVKILEKNYYQVFPNKK